MAWNDTKQTNRSQPDVPANEKVTSGEWNTHVDDQESRGYVDISTQTGNYTASPQEVVLADASGGGITVTLPSPTAAAAVTVKKIDSSSNAVTVATPGSETIDGSADMSITGQWISREVMSDGNNYYII